MMNKFTYVNVNQVVYLRLTDIGWKIMQQRHAMLDVGVAETLAYVPRPVSAEGFTAFYMWEIMNAFGPHVMPGTKTEEMPFDGLIFHELPQPAPAPAPTDATGILDVRGTELEGVVDDRPPETPVQRRRRRRAALNKVN